ncbi:Octicosapeptide/Phox/Bem1p domain-containing protein [Melia azedarach]|uniref:Octicosapeptide/Phox/Bem1p domain-containing protein n=1 Tax=Melia azedarach TaxID=155640 RepID=A0ACC1XK13_MELAZ|nr:Octicosapeptide/Phox/Bem1p domain-containing protein [Melia azedarach]
MPTLQFLCSYGGKILPRYPDGKLRYHGGETRVLAVHRSISFAELLFKLGEMCGTTMSLRCQLPTEDLDALVSITSDEDLANLIEEYDRVASPPSSLKIRAFLSLPKKISSKSSSSSPTSSSSASSSPKSSTITRSSSTNRCHRQIPAPVAFPLCLEKSAAKSIPHHAYYAHGNPTHIYLIHNGNYWQ